MSNEELRRLATAATPGPWAFGAFHRLLIVPLHNGVPDKHDEIADLGNGSIPWTDESRAYNNAAYIAATSPDVVLALLADLDALRTRLAEVEKDAANSKPNCRECTKWAQEQADNREWIDAVARGKVICKQLASEAMNGGRQ